MLGSIQKFSGLGGAIDIAIDLGTANTLIACLNRELIFNEPSVVALKSQDRTFVASGVEAARMFERHNADIITMWPVRSGVIVDLNATALMLQGFVNKIFGATARFRRILISVPRDATEVERRCFQQAAARLSPGEVLLTYEPLAAAVGAGLDILKPHGRMLVDVGSGITEAVVISMGKVVGYESVRLGGESINQQLVEMVRQERGLRISLAMAERLKIALASSEEQQISIKGQWIHSRLPGQLSVPVDWALPVFDKLVDVIARCVETTLRTIDPHLVTDICEDGIWLSGGGVVMPWMRQSLTKRLQVNFRLVPEPMVAVAIGNRMLLENRMLRQEATARDASISI